MEKHGRKIVAPLAVTVCVLVYLAFYSLWLIDQVRAPVLKVLLAFVPAILGAVMIGVCVQRIREIKGGEEDDLGQY